MNATRPPQTEGNKVSRNKATCNIATQLACSYCKGNHIIYKCDKFKAIQPRKRFLFVKGNKLCYNCLKQNNNKGHNCSTYSCHRCYQKHHTLLHFDKPQSNHSDTKFHNKSETVPADVNSTSNAEADIYCTFKGKPRNHILLATAVVHVRDNCGRLIPCRALLDSAAQSHFVTESVVQRLRLKKSKRVSIRGINDRHYNTSGCFHTSKV